MMDADMALKDTLNAMQELLSQMMQDLDKTARGNCAAAQRVRTGSIKFAKIAKVFRKESVDAERGIKKAKSAARKKRD